jgi:XTP/dITP diphosphohydrolase
VQLTVLLTSPRLPVGLLGPEAWRALEGAERVLVTDPAWAAALSGTGTGPTVAPVLIDPSPGLARAASDAGAADGAATVLLVEASPDDVTRELPAARVVPPPEELPGSRLLELVQVMDRLRTGCPWDREQTHRSLATYLLEETYETLEAIETGDTAHLQEELGDLLLQVVFHARIATEDPAAGFDIDDVARGIADKLVYRHPHVFAGLEVEDAAEVDRNWESLKAAEKQRTSPVDGIPPSLPALAYADKVLGRLAKAGVTAEGSTGAPDLGGRLLALVAEARGRGLDAEQELRDAVRRMIATALTTGPTTG